jgi:peptidoglycan/xylan/chitin deacetylase (PgdA/CDA1 family)
MKLKVSLLFLTFSLLASGCDGRAFAAPIPTAMIIPASTQPPLPTSIPSPIVEPYTLNVTVWSDEPRVPVLTYHQLAPDTSEYSTGHKVRVSDLRAQLDGLNRSGFTLVALNEWINGNVNVPAGRKPLVITMDDLFYNNQITLGPDGIPAADTAIGIFWQFGQEHPEFGFHLTLFADLGDKLYADYSKPDWEEKLARAIAWCMDHGAPVYNHTYTHVRLDKTKPDGIKSELHLNDLYLRELLTKIDRQDLIPALGNMLALPYGFWPIGNDGLYAVRHYANPEGLSMQAIFTIDYPPRAGYMAAPYSSQFDPLNIPRIAARPSSIEYLLGHPDKFPAAESCTLGNMDKSRLLDSRYLAERIALAIRSEACPGGVYQVGKLLFDASASTVTLISP